MCLADSRKNYFTIHNVHLGDDIYSAKDFLTES